MKINYGIKELPEFITTENIHLLRIGQIVKIISGANREQDNGKIGKVISVDDKSFQNLGYVIIIKCKDVDANCYNYGETQKVKLEIIK